MPLINKVWWERNYPYVSFGLAAVIGAYYLFVVNDPGRMGHALEDYISFIVFPTALFVLSGGIYTSEATYSTPKRNLTMLLIGIVLTNFIGSTGASLLLIRPFIRANKYRLSAFHIIFFIFIIGNIGGGLTPIGSAPLFLGYIVGIPYFWSVSHLWAPWLFSNILLLIAFYIFDARSFSRVEEHVRAKALEKPEKFAITGWSNVLLFPIVIAAVFIQHPLFLREGIMLVVTFISYYTTNKEIHKKNQFIFLPMQEVAILFFGIFVTIVPALEWLEQNAGTLNLATPGHYFWSAGIISSVLDNAPTYLSFLTVAMGTFGLHINAASDMGKFLQQDGSFLAAISLGAAFFGAATYIGNAPNFMVKSIAEHDGVDLPHFGKYITNYAVPILLPIFALVWWLFV